MNFTRDHRKISSRRYSWNDINRSSSPSSGDPATGIVPSASYIERSTTVATGSYRFRILEHTMTGMTCRQNQPRNVFRYIKYRSVIIRAVIQGRDYKVNTCCHLSASRHHDFSPFPFSSWVFGVEEDRWWTSLLLFAPYAAFSSSLLRHFRSNRASSIVFLRTISFICLSLISW